MIKAITAILLFWSVTALADVNAHFSKGVLGLKWRATFQEVQVAYPGGTSWPNSDGDGGSGAVYEVQGDFRVLTAEVPAPIVHFVFSKNNELETTFFHFKYLDREAALNSVVQILGRDYSIHDAASSRIFTWKLGNTLFARFEVGAGPQFPWAYFAVQSKSDQANSQKPVTR